MFVSGPYSNTDPKIVEENVNAAIDMGIKLRERGHFPFIPHLFHWVDQRANETGHSLTYQDYMEWDEQFLRTCDAIMYLGKSPGADKELELAERLGLIVLYPEDLNPSSDWYDW